MSKPFAAEFFLRRLKPLLAARKVVFSPRSRKTKEFMLAEGLVVDDILDVLSQLRPEHYIRGPEDDRDGSGGNVMVFHFPYDQRTLYIKLKLWTDSSGEEAAVISFHEEGKHD